MRHANNCPLQVLISFSPEDRYFKEQLVRHLHVLARFAGVEIWDVARARAGTEWQREFDAVLDRAQVALLLISANFLASEFLQDVEVPKLFERRARGGIKIIPVLVRTCLWSEHSWLGSLQPLPKGGHFIASLNDDDKDRAFTEVVAEVAAKAREYPRGRANEAPSPPSPTTPRRRTPSTRDRTASAPSTEPNADISSVVRDAPELDTQQLHALRLLTRRNGTTSVTWLAERIGILPLEATLVVRRLVKQKLVMWTATNEGEPLCSLTTRGLDYVCARGLVLKELARPVRRKPPTELHVSLPPHATGVVQDISEDGSGMGVIVDCAIKPGVEVTIEVDARDRTRAFCARVVHCRRTSFGAYFVGLYIVQAEARQRLQTRIGDLVTWKNHSSMPPAE